VIPSICSSILSVCYLFYHFANQRTESDNVHYNDVPYYKRTTVEELPNVFPYLGLAQSGQNHWHTNPFFTLLLSWVGRDAGVTQP
jgi:hypothetical protein